MSKRRADASDAIVGHNIRLHRLARRMSQTELAKAIGLTFQQVQKYEKGTNRVGAGRLVQIAGALKVPVMALLKGVPGLGGKAEPATAGLLAHPHRLRVAQAFAAIDDTAARRALMMLAEAVARLGQGAKRTSQT